MSAYELCVIWGASPGFQGRVTRLAPALGDAPIASSAFAGVLSRLAGIRREGKSRASKRQRRCAWAALSIALSLIVVRCDSRRRAPTGCLTCLDGDARDPQQDVALLAHRTGWMSARVRDRYFEDGVLDRA